MDFILFRSSFLDLQNKAEFSKAAIRMVHAFKEFQMEENSKNQNDEDYMRIFSSKRTFHIFWRINGKNHLLTFSKDIYNEFKFIENSNPKFPGSKVSIYDRKMIIKIQNKIADLYTGKNWGEIEYMEVA